VMPHFNHAGPFKYLMRLLRRRLSDGQFMLGIDEDTALVGKRGGDWKVMGASQVHVITRNKEQSFAAGASVSMPGRDGR
jgi:cyanophycinase-like exopeptidase